MKAKAFPTAKLIAKTSLSKIAPMLNEMISNIAEVNSFADKALRADNIYATLMCYTTSSSTDLQK